MAQEQYVDFNIGLSEAEKNDLEQMIGEFQRAQVETPPSHDWDAVQRQINAMNKRLAHLTTMFLTIDRRMKPLYHTVRLACQKTDLLNQRINAIIDSLRTGEPL